MMVNRKKEAQTQNDNSHSRNAGWMDEWTNKRTNDCMNEWMNGRIGKTLTIACVALKFYKNNNNNKMKKNMNKNNDNTLCNP